MTYTIKSKGREVKQMTLENGTTVLIGKRRSYGNRTHWTVFMDGKHIAYGMTVKECAEDFISKAQ